MHEDNDDSGRPEDDGPEGEPEQNEPEPFEGLGDVLHNGEPIRSHSEGFHYFSACFEADPHAAYARARKDWPTESLGNIDAWELVIAAIEALARQSAKRWVRGYGYTLRTGCGLLYWAIDMARRSEVRSRAAEKANQTEFDPALGHGRGSSSGSSEVTSADDESLVQRLHWLVTPPVELGITMLTPERAAALRAQLLGRVPEHDDAPAAARWRSQLRHARATLAQPIRAAAAILGLSPGGDNEVVVDTIAGDLLELGWISWDLFEAPRRRYSQAAMDEAIEDMRRRADERWNHGSAGRD